jgi:hypothetical protein
MCKRNNSASLYSAVLIEQFKGNIFPFFIKLYYAAAMFTCNVQL